jgi:hypothetical protein
MFNFRKENFNLSVESKLKDIYDYCHNGEAEELENSLIDAKNLLIKYFNKTKIKIDFDKTEISIDDFEDKAILEANEVFSQFLQNLIYYVCHNIDLKYQESLLEVIFSQEEFLLFKSESNNKSKIILWIDPKEKDTALHSLCRNGHLKYVEKFINCAKNSYNDDLYH